MNCKKNTGLGIFTGMKCIYHLTFYPKTNALERNRKTLKYSYTIKIEKQTNAYCR